MTFSNWLKEKGACREGYEAHHAQTTQEFWNTCERADWMLWVAERKYGAEGWPDHAAFVRIAAACASDALVYVPAGEDRPRLAVEAALAWVENPCEETRAAAWAARDAARAAAGAAAGAAAWDARAAAGAAAGAAAWDARDAARAAGDAARAAAGAAGDAANKAQADHIRAIWPTVGE